ncbi:MAG: putative hydrolase YxeP [Cryomorphaceae bacterium]|nr:MAG: putative hydrolase YxeP [Cryomorphaceae bacterium]
MIAKIKQLAESIFDEVVSIRRHLHKNPELSFNEYKTSAYIKSVLSGWDIPFTEDIADTGIVVLLKGNNPSSKTIALRADFDALPIVEENEVDYCSVNNGVMHACGHDAHTASLLGVINILNTLKTEWEGSIKFIFQPAEEMLPGGAQQMIKEGVLDNPKVEKMLGQHVFPDLEVGKVGFRPGIYMASTDELHITIKGKGGHAALPEKYNSPLLAAAKLITALDEFSKKEKDRPCVLAIGFIEGLGSTNVIPEQVKLKGTLRAMNEDFRIKTHEKMLVIANTIAEAYSLIIDFDIRKGYPCLVNDEALAKKSIVFAKEYMGAENVIDLPIRMTAEDFSYYSHQVPSCFYRLGTAKKSKRVTHGLHTSRFNIDESSLKVGMGLMAYLAIKN